ALREKGGIVAALADGFYLFDFKSGEATPVGSHPAAKPNTRFNDGKTDVRGRFIAGTIDPKLSQPLGSIYSLASSLQWKVIHDGMGCTNGPCFSPDNRTFYCADTAFGTMWAYDYDVAAGSVSNKRRFATNNIPGSKMDGATVDADGRIWSVH